MCRCCLAASQSKRAFLRPLRRAHPFSADILCSAVTCPFTPRCGLAVCWRRARIASLTRIRCARSAREARQPPTAAAAAADAGGFPGHCARRRGGVSGAGVDGHLGRGGGGGAEPCVRHARSEHRAPVRSHQPAVRTAVASSAERPARFRIRLGRTDATASRGLRADNIMFWRRSVSPQNWIASDCESVLRWQGSESTGLEAKK